MGVFTKQLKTASIEGALIKISGPALTCKLGDFLLLGKRLIKMKINEI